MAKHKNYTKWSFCVSVTQPEVQTSSLTLSYHPKSCFTFQLFLKLFICLSPLSRLQFFLCLQNHRDVLSGLGIFVLVSPFSLYLYSQQSIFLIASVFRSSLAETVYSFLLGVGFFGWDPDLTQSKHYSTTEIYIAPVFWGQQGSQRQKVGPSLGQTSTLLYKLYSYFPFTLYFETDFTELPVQLKSLYNSDKLWTCDPPVLASQVCFLCSHNQMLPFCFPMCFAIDSRFFFLNLKMSNLYYIPPACLSLGVMKFNKLNCL